MPCKRVSCVLCLGSRSAGLHHQEGIAHMAFCMGKAAA